MNAKNPTSHDRDAVKNIRQWMSILQEQQAKRTAELSDLFDRPVTVSKWHPRSQMIMFAKSVGSKLTYARIERLVKLGFLEQRTSDGCCIEICINN